MKTSFVTIIALIFCLSRADAQRPKPKEALETGGERKLGVVYKTVGKRKLEFDMYYPLDEKVKPCPVVVYTHGGGWAAGSRFGASRGSFAILFKELVKQGLCVVSVDYRLCKQGGDVRMRDCVIDSKDAVRYLTQQSEKLGIDPERIFVFGDSAGGHIAQMLLLSPPGSLTGDPDLAKVDYHIVAGVSWYGPCDFVNVDLFNHDDRPNFKDRFEARIVGADSTTEDKLRLYREMSPVSYLTKDSPPLLMIQGDQDTTIPVKHAYRMEKRAEELEAPVKVMIVKNSGHNWRKAGEEIEPSRESIIEATVEFFKWGFKVMSRPPTFHPMRAVKTMRLWVVFYALSFALTMSARAADIYVAVNGDDAWSGHLAEPNSEKNDGPFATLERARDAVQELKDKGKDIVVQIRGGNYRLSETVVFGLEDSGVKNSTITYEAFPDEKPVFHSDIEIGGWEKMEGEIPFLPNAAQGKVWVTDAPQMNGAPRHFFTLYDSEGRLPRARSEGFIPVSGSAKASKTVLSFPPGLLRDWPNLDDVEIVVRPHHAWIVNILPLASVNMQKQIAKTSIPATYAMDELHFLKGTESVWVENVIDALDQPGEWVLDTKKGKIYLWPRGDAPPIGIAAPKLQEYFRVEGGIDIDAPADSPVRNLSFRGLTFTRGESYRVEADDKGLQHDWEMHDKANALLRLRGAENCTIEKCHFTQSGGSAIRVDLHGQNIQIQDNHIEYIGATGILLCGYGPGTKDANHHNLVFNNHIHHVGEIYAHAPGVFLWQSGENRVANNLIHHTPYAGIIVSGVMTDFFSKYGNNREMMRTIRWQEVGRKRGKRTLEDVRPFLHSHDNLVEYNEIHHAMEQLGDGNGIYIRGAGAGNVIRRNCIHDLVSPVALQSAIRTDGGQRDTLISENLIYRCVSQGIQVKLNNRVENNIVANLIEPIHKGKKVPAAYLKLREGPMTGCVIQRNILYHPGARAVFFDQGRNPRLPAAWAKEADTDFNLYYSAGDPEVSQAVLEKAKSEGIDAHSLAADPLFVDPANGDFRLKPDSPALKLGFVPIDQSKIGLRDDR